MQLDSYVLCVWINNELNFQRHPTFNLISKHLQNCKPRKNYFHYHDALSKLKGSIAKCCQTSIVKCFQTNYTSFVTTDWTYQGEEALHHGAGDFKLTTTSVYMW